MATEYTNMKQVLQQGGELMADAIRDEAISKGLFKTGTLARSYLVTASTRCYQW